MLSLGQNTRGKAPESRIILETTARKCARYSLDSPLYQVEGGELGFDSVQRTFKPGTKLAAADAAVFNISTRFASALSTMSLCTFQSASSIFPSFSGTHTRLFPSRLA